MMKWLLILQYSLAKPYALMHVSSRNILVADFILAIKPILLFEYTYDTRAYLRMGTSD